MSYTQEKRLIALDTPLGKDVLLLQGLSGREGVSQLFALHLDLLSEKHSIAFEKIVGHRVDISIIVQDGSKRYLNGFVSRISQSGRDDRFTHYQAEVVPWLWFLTRTSDCRIFQNMKVPDIITKIFDDLGFKDYKNQLKGSFEPRDYCVQYRETDYNFVSRLMEQYGISYFFQHEEKKHILVLVNSADVQPCPKQSKVRCDMVGDATLKEDVITACQIEQELKPGKYALTDFNFETPSTSLLVVENSKVKVGGNDKYEIYDYASEYGKRAEGEKLAKIRMEEEEASHFIIRGSSTCRAFIPGYKFDLVGHYRDEMNKSYLLSEVQHVASVGDSYTSQVSSGNGENYSNQFVCIPATTPYRAPRLTPKPIVQGSQTAIVVGKDGEEIWTDKYGRVKVQFHWDREGKSNENSSCWIRVSSPWAGKGWGGISIPRIGQEVLVDFIEGDPDQPIITGRVYNAENMPPYPLPTEQTKSTMKSNSSKGGGGSNEMRFEDAKGKEEVYLHGEKDWTIAIENDKNQTVGHDETLDVTNNRTKTVGVNQSETIGSNKTIHVGSNHVETIEDNQSVTVGMASAETIGLAKALTIGAGYQVSVGAAMNETVGGSKTEEVGLFSAELVGGNKTITIAKSLTEKVSKNISIDAGDEITIKTGKASIHMKKNGDILISGNDITIKGTGNIVLKAQKILEN